jgi:hypothetical protein
MRIIEILCRFLADLPRWGLFGLLVFAPWDCGSTRPWGEFLLTASLFVLLGLFLLSLLVKPHLPKLNLLSAILTGLSLLQGWIMVFNSKQILAQLYLLTSTCRERFPGCPVWWTGRQPNLNYG